MQSVPVEQVKFRQKNVLFGENLGLSVGIFINGCNGS